MPAMNRKAGLEIRGRLQKLGILREAAERHVRDALDGARDLLLRVDLRDLFAVDRRARDERERRAEAAEQAPKILSLVNPAGKRLLDLCCGPGRFAIPFARLGFRVTGVERTNYLLRKARARSKSTKVGVEWIERDMRDFIRPGGFDPVLSMFTSFGYFDDWQNRRVLENVCASLRPGGLFFVHHGVGSEQWSVVGFTRLES